MKFSWFIFVAIDLLLVAAVVAFVVSRGREREQQHEAVPSEEQLRQWESRAPGWKIRCIKCGSTEPWGKYGFRKLAAGRSYTWGYCTQCRRLRFYVIEQTA